jgi:5,10-methylene-tetrahydrofolate dehydrogenase/methenyl tetrahydrofolate cyclohydrolase
MPAKLLTGKEVTQKMDLDIQQDVQSLKSAGTNPRLRIIFICDA